MYWFFVFTWSLYGVAALLPYDTKNSMYNILDLFAKNFLGVFLVYILWTNRIE
jgi:bacteriorhodopsin